MSNPLLASIKLPGRTFQLPSKGLFYTNGELADTVNEGEIHVQAMSALEEIVMKNPDQLFSGEAINKVFPSCIPDIKKPEELLSKDVDAIMLFLRTVTYGPSYDITAKHKCKDAKTHAYSINIDSIITSMNMIEQEKIQDVFTIVASTGQVVKTRPTRYRDLMFILKKNGNRHILSASEQEDNLLQMLTNSIISVDGVTDEENIKEWIKKVPAPVTKKIIEKLESINEWGANLQVECVCKDCGETFKIDLPINPINFFTD